MVVSFRWAHRTPPRPTPTASLSSRRARAAIRRGLESRRNDPGVDSDQVVRPRRSLREVPGGLLRPWRPRPDRPLAQSCGHSCGLARVVLAVAAGEGGVSWMTQEGKDNG